MGSVCILLIASTILAVRGGDNSYTFVIKSFKSINNTGLENDLDSDCPDGYFSCGPLANNCVHQSSMCNGIFDCENQDDEKPTLCKNEHEAKYWDLYFPPRTDKDEELDESDICKYVIPDSHYGATVFTELETNANEDLEVVKPHQICHCQWEKFICANQIINNFSMIPLEVEYLDFSGSLLHSIDFNNPGFPLLENLILSNCYLKELPYGSFYKLSNLKILHLTGNQLTHLTRNAFLTNQKLERLFLGYNQISDVDSHAFAGLVSLIELDLRHNLLFQTKYSVFSPLKNLKILYLSHNKIQMIHENFLSCLVQLEVLSLSSNMITNIGSNVFQNLTTMQRLYLSENKLSKIVENMFCNLENLLDLQLQQNGIRELLSSSFSCLTSLESLNLERNSISDIESHSQVFKNLSRLEYIYFDEYWMCWWATSVKVCEPKTDGISSTRNLLENKILRICVWIMGLVSAIGNLCVVIGRTLVREPNRIHSFYIKNLAFADLLMGIYLFSIGIHDINFRGKFLSVQFSWRHSVTCQGFGALCTWSLISSVMILALITCDRYSSIVNPFMERRLTFKRALIVTGLLWLGSFFLAYLPFAGLFSSYFRGFYSTNGLCLPLKIHNPYDLGWEYSFTLFVVLNSLIFLLIFHSYWKMLRAVRASSISLRTNQQKQEGLLAKRFSMVVLTDFVCFSPIFVLLYLGVKINPGLYAWLAVFILPVNASLNPIIYSLTTKMFIQQLSHLKARWTTWGRSGNSEDSTISISLYNRNRSYPQAQSTSCRGSVQTNSSRKVQLQVHIPTINQRFPLIGEKHQIKKSYE